MYAITATSFRAISSVDELRAGEISVDTLPDNLLSTIKATAARSQRDAMLAACDWTQGADSPLDATAKTSWAIYRQALRDVPAQASFPDSINWPVQP